MTNTNDNRTVVAFHIGRGGLFYNPGHKEYEGEINFIQLCNSQTLYLSEVNRDENGRFCRPYLIDAGGNTAVMPDDYGKEVGVINYDNDYDTWVCQYVEDCSDSELMLIYEAAEIWTDAYKYARVNLEANGMIGKEEEDEEI